MSDSPGGAVRLTIQETLPGPKPPSQRLGLQLILWLGFQHKAADSLEVCLRFRGDCSVFLSLRGLSFSPMPPPETATGPKGFCPVTCPHRYRAHGCWSRLTARQGAYHAPPRQTVSRRVAETPGGTPSIGQTLGKHGAWDVL